MSQVPISEVVETLRNLSWSDRHDMADRIEAHGIAPPEGYAIVPIEPTALMAMAGNDAWPETKVEMLCSTLSVRIYKAMLSAVQVKP